MTQKNFKYPFKLNDLPYVEDFTGTNGNSLRPELWELSSFTINNNMAYMSSGTASTITSSKFSLSGDFSIQVDVTTTAQPASEYWMMQLITKIDDSNNVYTSLGYFNGNFVYISRKKINNVFTDVFVSVQSAGAVASGTLKVSRINNVFYFGVNEVSLSSYDYSSAPDIQSVLLSHSNDTVSNIGSSWDNFTINSADDISWTYNFMDTFDGVDTDDPAENLWKNIIGESNTTRGLLSNKLRHTCSTGTNAAIVDVSKFKLSGDFDVQIDMDDISKITPSSSKTYGYDLVLSKEDQYLSDNFITDNYVYGRVGFNDTSLSNITTTKCIWDDEILNGEGDVHAWGRNNYGQCNHTNTTTPIYDETTVRISGVKEIACGMYHTVVLKENGDVHSWGRNDYGQCNHTNTTSPAYDETTVRISGVKEIACGGYHTVVLKENGDVHAWGLDLYGQCNHTNTTSPAYDETTVRISGVKEISGGMNHTVVLKENGDVHTWGRNEFGQCNHTNTTSPVYDETTVRISSIKEIACGFYHTVVLKENGDVHSWGHNEYGQCNHIDTTTPAYDETTVRISGVKEIACGFYHTVVLKENGDVHSWGHNVSGQCNHTNTTSPVYDETTVRISGIKEIACGGYHTVVLKEYEHPFIGTSQKMRVTRTISGSDSIINVFVTDIGTSVETHMIDGMIISNYVGDFDVILKQDNDDLNTDALSCDFNNFVINSCDKIIWPGGILKRWDGVNWISSVINKFTSQTGTTFTETFTGPNGDAPNIYYWIDRSYGGGSMQLNNNELELYAPASSSSGGGCNSIFHLSGDFIIDAEYDVTGATGNDYWWMGLSVSNPEYTAQWAAIKIEETSLINKAVSHRWDDDGANDGSTRVSRTSDIGKIRIQRIGTSISSFIDEGSGWVQVGSSETWINDNCYVVLQSYNSTAASIPTDFTSWFDNFEIVSADSIDWNDAGNWEDSILKRHDGSNWEYVGNIE